MLTDETVRTRARAAGPQIAASYDADRVGRAVLDGLPLRNRDDLEPRRGRGTKPIGTRNRMSDLDETEDGTVDRRRRERPSLAENIYADLSGGRPAQGHGLG